MKKQSAQTHPPRLRRKQEKKKDKMFI